MIPITFSEQFLLLTIDPVTGRSFPIPEQIVNLSLAGALLFEASFSDLINDDWEKLTVLNTGETGNQALDEVIRCLSITGEPVMLNQAVGLVAAHAVTLRQMIWDSMVGKGYVDKKPSGIVSNRRKEDFYQPDLARVVAIRQAIRETILNETVPEVNHLPVISLLVASGMMKQIVSTEELNQYANKIEWLANMEALGREIIRSIGALKNTDLEKGAARLIGLNFDGPKTYAGGVDAVLNALSFLYKETGMNRSRKIISRFNQVGGFECPGCAWPNPDSHRSRFEFCENGAKNVSAEATTRTITHEFFEQWSVPELLHTSGYWLEQQGRLTEPMYLDEGATHYKPISWEEAFCIVAEDLCQLDDPNEAVFYASGRTSNEAAFLYQLFARIYGTNNLPNSANLCHEPSGKALTMSLGYGKSSVSLRDFPKSDLIFLFGHNPGSNHPRMLSALQSAVRKGSKIIAVNPMPEASLMGFADPQEAGSYLGKQTRLASLYIQPCINGDMALVRGIAKALMDEDESTGKLIDYSFIEQYTSGFEDYRNLVKQTDWEEIVNGSGISREQIEEIARIYGASKNAIACWCLGITHHKNSIETLQEIINLILLKGNIGRPGAGLCPVRGHSNIQGIRTAGVGENMPVSFLEALEKQFPVRIPREPGLSVVPAIKAMNEGKVKVLISLGGNLASAVPDTCFTEKALRACRLTVMISTKLNRSHLVTGKRALILPALGRTDEITFQGTRQYTTVEDALGKIGFSQGLLSPASNTMKSEPAIVAGMAQATLGQKDGIDWMNWSHDYQSIRKIMSEIIPAYEGIDRLNSKTEGYFLKNPLKSRVFNTSTSKARFSQHPLRQEIAAPDELLLMTIRSHDQFNTSIFGLNDRYRGINQERRVVFMNQEDMAIRNIAPEQQVELISHYDQTERLLDGYYAIPYPITKGCAAAYFPETNLLTSINNLHPLCQTPAFKSVKVKIRAQK